MRKIYLLQNKIFDFLLTSKIITSKNIIFINEIDAYYIVQKLILFNPIYKIFCTGNSSLENLDLILDVHIGLLEDDDFIYGVAAFYCHGK